MSHAHDLSIALHGIVRGWDGVLAGVTCDYGDPPCIRWTGHVGDHLGMLDLPSDASPEYVRGFRDGWARAHRDIEP